MRYVIAIFAIFAGLFIGLLTAFIIAYWVITYVLDEHSSSWAFTIAVNAIPIFLGSLAGVYSGAAIFTSVTTKMITANKQRTHLRLGTALLIACAIALVLTPACECMEKSMCDAVFLSREAYE